MFCCPFADCGEVYTWGWKECIPSGKVFGEPLPGVSPEKDVPGRQSSFLTEQGMFDLFTMAICLQLPVPPRRWSKLAKVYEKELRKRGIAMIRIECLKPRKKEEKSFATFDEQRRILSLYL